MSRRMMAMPPPQQHGPSIGTAILVIFFTFVLIGGGVFLLFATGALRCGIFTGCQVTTVIYGGTEFTGGGKTGPQITVPIGTVVSVKVAINGAGQGPVLVEIRKDIVGITDPAPLTTFTKQVTVAATAIVEMGTFTASDGPSCPAGCVLPLEFREYFVRVTFNDILLYDPQDPNTREWVRTGAASGGVTYQTHTFTGAGQTGQKITVPVGTTVTIEVTLASTVSKSGTLSYQLKRDRISGSDDIKLDHQQTGKVIGLLIGQNKITFDFLADDGPSSYDGFCFGCFRSYFIDHLQLDGQDLYTDGFLEDWASRPHVETTGGTPPPASVTYTFPGATFTTSQTSGSQIVTQLGTTVDVDVKLNTDKASHVNLQVEVRQSIIHATDVTDTTLTKNFVSLASGDNTIRIGSFVANDGPTNYCGLCLDPSTWGDFRHYFIRLWINGTLVYNPEYYPSLGIDREWVETVSAPPPPPPGGVTVTYSSQAFNSVQVLKVPKGTQVTITITLTGTGSGTSTGELQFQLKRDLISWGDDIKLNYEQTKRTVTVSPGSNTVTFTFTADDGPSCFSFCWPGSFRSYFIDHIQWNGQDIYVDQFLENWASRPHVETT